MLNKFLIGTLALVLIAMAAAPANAIICPSGYREFRGQCYGPIPGGSIYFDNTFITGLSQDDVGDYLYLSFYAGWIGDQVGNDEDPEYRKMPGFCVYLNPKGGPNWGTTVPGNAGGSEGFGESELTQITKQGATIVANVTADIDDREDVECAKDPQGHTYEGFIPTKMQVELEHRDKTTNEIEQNLVLVCEESVPIGIEKEGQERILVGSYRCSICRDDDCSPCVEKDGEPDPTTGIQSWKLNDQCKDWGSGVIAEAD